MAVNTVLIKIGENGLPGGLKEARECLTSADGEIVLDCSSAHRVDVSDVRELGELAGEAEAAGKVVKLLGVNVDVYKVLKLTGLSRRFSFTEKMDPRMDANEHGGENSLVIRVHSRILSREKSGMLTSKNTVLVVVDVQGKLAQLMHGRERFFDSLQKIIKGTQVLKIPIVVTEQIPEKLGPTVPEIAHLLSGVQPIRKSSFSCGGSGDFVKALEETGRKQVLLTGMETHICVYQTAVDLLDSGHEVHIVADAVASRAAENREIGLERIKKAGAISTSVEMALFELLKVAEGEAFREIIKIVK